LSEVAGHARRIAFIFADELKAPPKVSRHLGESDGEHEAYRVIEDLYEFFKRLYDKSIRKCHSEEASSEGKKKKYFPSLFSSLTTPPPSYIVAFNNMLQKTKKRKERKELSLVTILVVCDSIQQNVHTPAPVRRKFFHLWADTMVTHYSPCNHPPHLQHIVKGASLPQPVE